MSDDKPVSMADTDRQQQTSAENFRLMESEVLRLREYVSAAQSLIEPFRDAISDIAKDDMPSAERTVDEIGGTMVFLLRRIDEISKQLEDRY